MKLEPKRWARKVVTDATLEVVAREFGERLQSLNLQECFGVTQAGRAARRWRPQLTRGRRALLRPTR